ncbi:MAG: hypothetical protein EHM55_19825 [Acidobacteria bacterium]|nr:MAG: hypothetical protein EHM55_19825 [Acidobacteriota bacterium]
MVRHVLDTEVQVVMRKLRMRGLAVPFGGRETLETPAERVAVAEELRQHLGRGTPRQGNEIRVAVGIVIWHDGRLFGQHPAEAVREDRFHSPEMTDQLLHRPFVRNRARGERMLVEARSQAVDLGRLGSQTLHQRKMDRMLAFVVTMMIAHGAHYRMCRRRPYHLRMNLSSGRPPADRIRIIGYSSKHLPA